VSLEPRLNTPVVWEGVPPDNLGGRKEPSSSSSSRFVRKGVFVSIVRELVVAAVVADGGQHKHAE